MNTVAHCLVHNNQTTMNGGIPANDVTQSNISTSNVYTDDMHNQPLFIYCLAS